VKMEIQKLIDSLNRQRQAIEGEAVNQMDFDQLQSDLAEAARMLTNLNERDKLCERLLADLKSDIARMALAVSRAKVEAGTGELVQRLISSPDASLDDLFHLRKTIREQFNHCFPVAPQSKISGRLANSQAKVSEFKTGV
jgi:hypothetical protein